MLEELTILESQVLDYDDPVTHHDDDAEEEAEEVKIWAGLDRKEIEIRNEALKASMVLHKSQRQKFMARGTRPTWCWKEIKRDKGKNGEGCFLRLANSVR